VFVVVRYNWLNRDRWHSTTAERRRIDYYDQKFTSSACAAELRLLGIGPRLSAPTMRFAPQGYETPIGKAFAMGNDLALARVAAGRQ
jgi:hypothetical protein